MCEQKQELHDPRKREGKNHKSEKCPGVDQQCFSTLEKILRPLP